MAIVVHRIDTYPGGDNSHVTDRSENWIVRRDASFGDLESARAYVREKSRLHTDLVLFLADAQQSQHAAIVDAFCFDDPKYLKHRRFFIGPPPMDLIRGALEGDGVQFVKR